jgi:TRAP-type C4-dicarboxylate transport system permease small subunit
MQSTAVGPVDCDPASWGGEILKKLKADAFVNAVGSIAIVTMLVLSLFNVLCDWFFDMKFGQIDEIILAVFVWSVYVGMGSLYKHDEHIRISFVVNMVSAKAKKAILLFDDIVSFVSSLIVTYYAAKLTLKSYDKFTQVVKIRYFYIDMAVVLGFASLVLIIGSKYLRRLRKKER